MLTTSKIAARDARDYYGRMAKLSSGSSYWYGRGAEACGHGIGTEINADELADPDPIYQALAKCSVALEVSFSDIRDYEAVLEIFRAASPAGEQMYPDLMEGLLDIACIT